MMNSSVEIRLLGRFALTTQEREFTVAPAGERVLAYLGLHGTVRRDRLAWTLWQDRCDELASHCLRSTLWRLPKPFGRALVDAHRNELRLADDVALDVRRSRDTALALLDGDDPPTAPTSSEVESWALDLLPGWYDDWLIVERERYRQLRFHALELLSERSLHAGHHAKAIELALQVVASDALRETAHRCIIRAHLAEGNVAAAKEQLQTYLVILCDADLDIALSPALAAEVANARLANAASTS